MRTISDGSVYIYVFDMSLSASFLLSVEKEMSDACVARLVRAVDRQSKDLGSNPGTVESVSFSAGRFLNSLENIIWIPWLKSLKCLRGHLPEKYPIWYRVLGLDKLDSEISTLPSKWSNYVLHAVTQRDARFWFDSLKIDLFRRKYRYFRLILY